MKQIKAFVHRNRVAELIHAPTPPASVASACSTS